MGLSDRRRMWKLAGRYSSVGIEMVVALGLGVYCGRWLDQKLNTEPYMLWFGILVGIGVSVKTLIRVSKTKLDNLDNS